jgi:hypothetical protein
MDPRQLIQRLVQLKQESEAIMQQLSAAGVPQEAVLAALQGGQGAPPMAGPPGMGAGPPPMGGPPGMPRGGPPQGMPRGLLGGM